MKSTAKYQGLRVQIQPPKSGFKAKPSKTSLEDRIKRMKERASTVQDPLLYSFYALRGGVCRCRWGKVENVGAKGLILIAMHLCILAAKPAL